MGDLVIPIMLVGAVDLVTSALAAVLANEDDLEVTPALALREEVVAAARANRPAVVVIDVDQSGGDGLEVARWLAEAVPDSRVLLLTGRQTAAMLRRALAVGVWGLVSPDSSPEHLSQLVRQVAGGERVVDPALAAAALRPADDPLTGGERAVLRLAGAGLRSREIAERVFLAPGTVRNYLSAAMRKTGTRNRLEAFRRAQEWGWL